MKIVIFSSCFVSDTNVIKMLQILGDFYPVYRMGPLGGPFLLKITVKQVIFEHSRPKYVIKQVVGPWASFGRPNRCQGGLETSKKNQGDT